jgi:hypothetical protein
MSATHTLLFVCLHGAGMSRMAAAYFIEQRLQIGMPYRPASTRLRR